MRQPRLNDLMWRYVSAYPKLSGVPDIHLADQRELEKGFERLLHNSNIRAVLEASHEPETIDWLLELFDVPKGALK